MQKGLQGRKMKLKLTSTGFVAGPGACTCSCCEGLVNHYGAGLEHLSAEVSPQLEQCQMT